MLGANSTCHERGACGANGAAPSAATRDEVMKPPLRSGRFRPFLFQPELRRPGAVLHHLKVAPDPVGSDLVRMRAVTPPGKHAVRVDRVVELRVIREQDRRTRGGGLRGDVLLRPRFRFIMERADEAQALDV